MNKDELVFKLVEVSDKPKYIPPWENIAKDYLNPTKKEMAKYLKRLNQYEQR